MTDLDTIAAAERERLLAVYRRRSEEVSGHRYAPWHAGEDLIRSERRRVAAWLLQRHGVFPQAGTPCLEIGCGALGWLGDLVGWGVAVGDLHGIDLDGGRIAVARQRLAGADLRTGDAVHLPWPAGRFRLVIASTVFTSIVAVDVRRAVAQEVSRVLAPAGALLWYDFAVPNPRNRDVRAIGRREIAQLFPHLRGEIRRITLAPPLARFVAPRSWTLATLLGSVPLLRTHLLAVLVKQS